MNFCKGTARRRARSDAPHLEFQEVQFAGVALTHSGGIAGAVRVADFSSDFSQAF